MGRIGLVCLSYYYSTDRRLTNMKQEQPHRPSLPFPPSTKTPPVRVGEGGGGRRLRRVMGYKHYTRYRVKKYR